MWNHNIFHKNALKYVEILMWWQIILVKTILSKTVFDVESAQKYDSYPH